MFKCPGEISCWDTVASVARVDGVDSNSQSESEPWQELAIVGSFDYKPPS